MFHPLRAADRYPNASDELKGLIVEELHDTRRYDFDATCELYERFVPRMTAEEVALLGCNDRYFLLTCLLNRRDALHPWLFARCREVEAAPDGRIDLWSREHYKSTIITFAGTIQEILIDPEITIGIFSNTSAGARKFLAQIKRELEANEKLIGLFPDILWPDGKERKAAGVSWSLDTGITVKRQGNPKEATVEANGLLDSMPTGRHFRLMIFDDVITQNEVTNPEMLAKTAERFQLADNLGQADGSRVQIVGTRYSYADYYGEMLASGIAIARVYPATDDGTENGNPVFWTRPVWDRKRKTQRTTMAAQLLQNPLAGKENTFKVQWLKPYYVRPSLMNVYILGDPSHGHNKTSDRTAIAVIGVARGPKRYLLDGYRHRMQLQERWERLRDLQKRWVNMPGVVSVDCAWERYGMQSDLDYFLERQRIENCFFPIREVNWTGERGGEFEEGARRAARTLLPRGLVPRAVEGVAPARGAQARPRRQHHPARGRDARSRARSCALVGTGRGRRHPPRAHQGPPCPGAGVPGGRRALPRDGRRHSQDRRGWERLRPHPNVLGGVSALPPGRPR